MRARTALGSLLIAATVFLAALSAAGANPENGDGGLATDAFINGPAEISVGTKDNLYVLEMEGRRIRVVDMHTGIIKTVAGDGNQCCFTEGAKAVSTSFFAPVAMAVDLNGDVFVADISAHVRRVDAATGIATTVVSDLTGSGADKPGIAPSLPKFEQVTGLAIRPFGGLYVVGSSHGQIYSVVHGVVTVFAGVGGHGYAGDGKVASAAQFDWPNGIAVDSARNVFIADYENCRIRRIEGATGIVSTIAGSGNCNSIGDRKEGIRAAIGHPTAIALDNEGNIYFNDHSPACVRKLDARTLVMRSIPGTCDDKPDAGGAPSSLAVDGHGNLYMAYFGGNVVRRVDANTGAIKTVAGNGLPAQPVRRVWFPIPLRTAGPHPELPLPCPSGPSPMQPGEKPSPCE